MTFFSDGWEYLNKPWIISDSDRHIQKLVNTHYESFIKAMHLKGIEFDDLGFVSPDENYYFTLTKIEYNIHKITKILDDKELMFGFIRSIYDTECNGVEYFDLSANVSAYKFDKKRKVWIGKIKDLSVYYLLKYDSKTGKQII